MLRRCAFILPLLFSACATTIPNVPTTHIAMFDGSGTLVDPTHNTPDGGHSYVHPYPLLDAAQAADYRRKLLDSAMANAPVVDGKKQLLLYVHGGMKFQVSSVRNATALNTFMTQHNAPVYPIFINWQSSFFSTYWDHVAHIRQGQYWTGAGSVMLAPLWFFGDLVRAVGHAPIDYFYEMKSIYDGIKPVPFYDAIRVASESGEKPVIRHGRDTRTPARKVIGFATETVTLPLKFGTGPLVDGIGTGAWDAMQHRTTTLFENDQEFTEPLPLVRPSEGGLSIFLRELEDRIRADGHEWSITLVGHSMGAIVVNQIVARHPNLPIARIVYLAAACSLESYRTTVVPYVLQHPKVTMRHVILERHAEAREWNAYDIVPRGTLLVWIDNLLSKPESVLQRRAGRYTNLMRDIHSTPPSIIDRVTVLTFDGGPDLADVQPQSHGDAGSVQFWRDDCVIPRVDYPSDCMIH
jgi:hypothetical protein